MRFSGLPAAALCAVFLCAAPAHAAAPTVDGACNTGAASTACPTNENFSSSSITLTFSSSSAAGCVVVLAYNNLNGTSAAPTVSTVAKTSGTGTIGTFTKRASVIGQGSGADGTSNHDLEIWSAPYTSTLSSAVVTITFSGTPSGTNDQGIAVTGTNGNACSWDSHAGVSTSGTLSSGVLAGVSQTSSQTDDLLLGEIAAESGTITTGQGATCITAYGGTAATQAGSGALQGSGANYQSISATYLTPSAGAGAITTTFKLNNSGCGGNPNDFAVALADALTADPPSGGGGGPHRLPIMGVGP